MAAIQQYIDLYRENSGVVDANGAPILNALRPRALAALEAKPLPRRGAEDYETVDLDAMIAPDFGLNLCKLDIDVNTDASFRCDLPVSRSASLFLNVNDTFTAPADSGAAPLPEGVQVGSLRDVALEHPELIREFYGRIADIENPIVALDTLFAQDGMFMRVPRGVRLERPVQLVNILASASPLMAVRRLLVIIDDDAEARLLVCDHSQRDDLPMLALETVEIFVGDNARFDYCDVEESTATTSRLSALYLSQGAGSEVNVNGITLFNGNTRNEYYSRFRGENASLKLYGMGIADGERNISTLTRIDHDVPRCKSDELFKFSLDDQARGGFAGRIYVAPGAVGTEAYQANRNLVGDAGARMFSKPQLEIYNDDVKCSHGCATGQLDPMQVFYMRSRGLDEAAAHRLLRQAFMADVIDAITIPSLRDRLHILVERRFSGAKSACSACASGDYADCPHHSA